MLTSYYLALNLIKNTSIMWRRALGNKNQADFISFHPKNTISLIEKRKLSYFVIIQKRVLSTISNKVGRSKNLYTQQFKKLLFSTILGLAEWKIWWKLLVRVNWTWEIKWSFSAPNFKFQILKDGHVKIGNAQFWLQIRWEYMKNNYLFSHFIFKLEPKLNK